MDNGSWVGLGLLAGALAALACVVAAEAGVIAGFQAHLQAVGDKEMSRLEVLRRYGQERQLTLSSLSLARNLTLVSITAIIVFLILDAAGLGWATVTVAIFATVLGLMAFEALTRLLVSQDPERWSEGLRPFVMAVRTVFGLPARLLDIPQAAAIRLWRARHPAAVEAGEADELLGLAALEAATGMIPAAEKQMIRGVMEMEQTIVKEIMVPRIDMVAVEANANFEEVAKLIVDKGYSRLPIYEETIDNIIGVVFAREVLRHLAQGSRPTSIRDIARPPYFVPESKRVDELLAEMRRDKMSIAIIVDEYGGTAGLVTIEDLLEEIVGEIADEFDIEEPKVQRLNDNEAIVDARVGIDILNEQFDTDIEKDDFETVGGFIYDHLGKMPSVGDEVEVDGLQLRVLSVLGRRIMKVQVLRKELPPSTDANNGGKAEA